MAQTQAELYKDLTITADDLASNSVTTPKIQDGSITRAKLADEMKPAPFTTRGFNDPI